MKNDYMESKFNQNTMDSRFQQSDHAAELLAEQIKLLYQQAPKALIVSLIIAAALTFVFWNLVAKVWLVGWLAAIYLLTFARFLLIKSYFRKNPAITESPVWGRRFLIGTLLSGVLWGIAGSILFVSGSAMHQLFLAYLLGGMVAGAMATLSSYKWAFPAFSIPVVLPFTYQVVTHESDIHLILALTYLLFVFAMGSISHRLHHTVSDSLKFRFENFDLLKRLIQAKNHQNAINRVLQTQIAEKDRSQKALQTVKEQLEQRVMERTEALALANDVLYQEKELFQVTLASIGDAVITTDSSGKITYLNPVAEIFTGWHNQEANGAPLQQVFNILDTATRKPVKNPLDGHSKKSGNIKGHRECLLIRKNKQEWIIDYSVAPIQNEQEHVIGTVLTFRDVTEQRKITQKLAYQATHDSLTGLLNRKEFEARLSKILASTRKNDTHALLYLDLDQFKIINDSCGHSAGDELLRQVTVLFQSKLRTRDTLARLGGDEFGIILEHCPQNEALQVAHTLRELVQNFRYHYQNKTFTIGVSIGFFPITHANEGLTHALNAADSACYEAKDQGRNRVHVYQAADKQQKPGETQWLPRIQQAIADQRLYLYFQPIRSISGKNGLEEHGEILLRLKDEHGQLIMPGAFLPAAERHDQMLMIDRWVIQQLFKLLKAHARQPSNAVYTINLSAQALGNTDFLNFTVDSIKASKINPANICFEITEHIALADLKHVMHFISTIKELGCRISIDNFGSGVSSFGYLKNFPLDYLKIDGRLIKDMATDPVDHAMVESINRIGHVMRLKTIAGWVENAQTLQLLENMGIDYAQGFWLAEPQLFHSGSEKSFNASQKITPPTHDY
ncbi:diguanylate cyclase/phosphodiesterase with PAS/PAC sensor(s) [Nitrosomonas sp. Is79A3]|uniref:EAL domain-containing protein n=1 Tax=Nitrosomonas sp. (strain Is79A3) TaxID=261292 RepID=UPI000215C94C